MGNGNFRPPAESTLLNRPPINLSYLLLRKNAAHKNKNYVGDPYSCAKFRAHPPMRGFWANGWNITIFIYTPFCELTSRLDPSTDFRAWWLRRSKLANNVQFWVLLIYGSPFRWSKPENPNFGGVTRHFQAKLAKSKKRAYYQNYRTDANQILHNYKNHQMLFVNGQNKRTTNPRWRTAAIMEKSRKIIISQQRFGRLSQNLARWRKLAVSTDH